jgi:hypothetical protein
VKESVLLLNPIIPYTEALFVPFNPTSRRHPTQETVDSGLERRPAGTSRCYETPQHLPQVSIRHICSPDRRIASHPAGYGRCRMHCSFAMCGGEKGVLCWGEAFSFLVGEGGEY